MKKIQAYWFRFWHCLLASLKGDMGGHLLYTEGTQHTYKGVNVWFTPTHVGCTCGKDYYGKSRFEIHHD